MSTWKWEEPEAIFRAYFGDGNADAPERPAGLSRRALFRISAAAGGGLLLAMALPGCKTNSQPAENKAPGAAKTEPPAPVAEASSAPTPAFEPSAFVQINTDGSATITVARSEMGQGVRTTLALLIAEELDLDWSRVHVATAPSNPKKYGNQNTGGSAAVRTSWKPLRQAGAAARAMLVQAAAQTLGVPAAELTTQDSKVLHAGTGRSVGYGELGPVAAKLTAPAEADIVLKKPEAFRLLGKERPGIDVDDILRGKATYGLDIRLPGMLYAAVARSPSHGGKVKSFDAAKAMAVPGVKKVVEVPAVGDPTYVRSGVAVLADNTWAALRGREALAIEWDAGPHAGESTQSYMETMRSSMQKTGAELVNRLGDPDRVLGAAKKVHRAQYEVPFLAHATMEPMNATAHVEGDRCRIYAGAQFPGIACESTAKALGIPVDNIELMIPLLGGGFGRRINHDYVVEAALIAKEAGAPVKVTWTREDDMKNDFYRPPAVHLLEASLGKDGYPEAWRNRMSTPAISAMFPSFGAKEFGSQESTGASNMLYRIPNRSCEYTLLPSGITRGWWRGVHTTHTTFAVECFLDELAELAGMDPVAYRLHLIDEYKLDKPAQNPEFPFDAKRLKGVVSLAAEKSGWGQPLAEGHGVGIACGIDHLSYAAAVIEVSVAGGGLKVHRVVCAADIGPVLNPNGARAQLEGGIIQALSAALRETITIQGGGVVQNNFHDYTILRINETPAVIETHFAPTDAHPTGAGEPSVPPIAPALSNAIYRATGKRLRTLPLTL